MNDIFLHRVLFIIPSLGRAGAEMQVVNLVNGIECAKYEKHLLCFERDLSLLDSLDKETVTFHYVRRNAFLDINLIHEISSLIDALKIDVIHCSLQFAFFMGWLGRSLSRRKPSLVVALHTTINRSIKAEIYDWLVYQWIMRSCQKVICVCKAQEHHWQKKFPFLKKQTVVIYNGVDVDFFSPSQSIEQSSNLRASLGLSADVDIICHIAAFRIEKGHAVVLDAFEQALKKKKDIVLVFAGDGELRNQIKEMVNSKKLSSRVRFLGSVSDVRPVLDLSEISVIASTSETFSMAMLESMAMETPVVAMDIGGTREAVIPDETGYLAPCRDALKLGDLIVNALNDKKRLKVFGKRARQYVIQNFSREKMIKQTSKVLEKMVE